MFLVGWLAADCYVRAYVIITLLNKRASPNMHVTTFSLPYLQELFIYNSESCPYKNWFIKSMCTFRSQFVRTLRVNTDLIKQHTIRCDFLTTSINLHLLPPAAPATSGFLNYLALSRRYGQIAAAVPQLICMATNGRPYVHGGAASAAATSFTVGAVVRHYVMRCHI